MEVDPVEKQETEIGPSGELLKETVDEQGIGPSSDFFGAESLRKLPGTSSPLGFEDLDVSPLFPLKLESMQRFDPWCGLVGNKLDPIALSERGTNELLTKEMPVALES